MIKVFLLFTILISITSVASEKCTELEAKTAEESTGDIKSWSQLFAHYKKFGHCDDGAISEGYSDVVSELLANQWPHLNELDKIIAKDSEFENFVVRHIDDTISQENNKKIAHNAKNKCPKGFKALCKKISKATLLP